MGLGGGTAEKDEAQYGPEYHLLYVLYVQSS